MDYDFEEVDDTAELQEIEWDLEGIDSSIKQYRRGMKAAIICLAICLACIAISGIFGDALPNESPASVNGRWYYSHGYDALQSAFGLVGGIGSAVTLILGIVWWCGWNTKRGGLDTLADRRNKLVRKQRKIRGS